MYLRETLEFNRTALLLIASVALAVGLPFLVLDAAEVASGPSARTVVLLSSLLSAVVLVLLGYYCFRSASGLGVRNAGFLIVGYLGLLYVGRPLFLLSRDVVGSHQIGYVEWQDASSTISTTSLIMLGSLVCFALAFVSAPSGFAKPILLTRLPARPGATLLLSGLALVAGFCALIVVRDLMAYPGGWQVAMVDRRNFFEGRVTLVWLMNLYRLGFLVWLALLCSGKIKANFFTVTMAVLFWGFSLGTDALSGSRMEIVLRNVLPTAMVLATLPKARRHSKLVNIVTVCLLVFIFVGYRTLVRDTHTDNINQPIFEQVIDNVVSLPVYFFEGDEASAFDYLVFTRLEVPDRLPHRGAETLEAMAKSLFPSSLVADKPERSSHLLTEGLRYEYSLRGGNIAFSGAADLYYSWGNAAIVVGYAIIGFLAGWTIKSCSAYQESAEIPGLAAIVAFTVAASFISVFRADLYELPLLFLRLMMLYAVYVLLIGNVRSKTGVSHARDS